MYLFVNILKYQINSSFHHKKGCIKDSEYPPDNVHDFDIERLPSLCLPDQSHNYESDSVYFVLPNPEEDGKRIFGNITK